MMRWLVATWLAVTGCELTYAPDTGPLQAVLPDSGAADDGKAALESCSDTTPFVSVRLSQDIRPMLVSRCDCHDSRATSGFSMFSYERLRNGGTTAGANVIIPGKPCDSVIVQKLSPFPPFGARMPFSSGGSTYFNPTERALVNDWIAEGALDN